MWQFRVIEAFYNSIKEFDTDEKWQECIENAYIMNKWFTPENVNLTLTNWRANLQKNETEKWLSDYSFDPHKPNATLGLIMAGNIPLVGMHDILCGLLCGYKIRIKCSTNDEVLPKAWINRAILLLPELADHIEFSDSMKGIDLAIATGSNNSHRYFEYYFKTIPHLLRKNRNSAAVLDGNETEEQLQLLGHDVFDYFGLGCRNVTKLYLPENYSFKILFDAWKNVHYHVINHNKYANNFQYHRALLLMNLDPHIDNGFILLKEKSEIYSPIGMLNYTFYSDPEQVKMELQSKKEEIQCIVSTLNIEGAIKPGQTQNPSLWDYADGKDTLAWLLNVQSNSSW